MSKQFYFKIIQFSISTQVQCQKILLFQTIQFIISTQFSSIWPIDRTLSTVTIPGQTGPRSDGNEGVLRIPQGSSFIEASPSDCFVSYPGHSLGCLTPQQRNSRYILQLQPTGPLIGGILPLCRDTVNDFYSWLGNIKSVIPMKHYRYDNEQRITVLSYLHGYLMFST